LPDPVLVMKNVMPDEPCALDEAGDMPVQPATIIAIAAPAPYVSRVISQISWVGLLVPGAKSPPGLRQHRARA
jgi:hypothetical protein